MSDEPEIHVYEWATPQTDDEWALDYPWAVSFGPFLEPIAMFTEKSFAEAAAPGLLASVTAVDWDRVHNRPADIYTPPEDRVSRHTIQQCSSQGGSE